MATPGPGIKQRPPDLHDSMQALRLLPSDRGVFENETKGWYVGLAYLRTISWPLSITSKVWISEMRGTRGLRTVMETQPQTCLVRAFYLFILNATSTLHLLITQTTFWQHQPVLSF